MEMEMEIGRWMAIGVRGSTDGSRGGRVERGEAVAASSAACAASA